MNAKLEGWVAAALFALAIWASRPKKQATEPAPVDATQPEAAPDLWERITEFFE